MIKLVFLYIIEKTFTIIIYSLKLNIKRLHIDICFKKNYNTTNNI